MRLKSNGGKTTHTDDIDEMLAQTRGLWADWDEVEGLIEDARQKWNENRMEG